MTNSFVDKVSEQISDKHSRTLITAELESHLLDKIDYYVDIGYSKEDAEKRATEEMGNPDDTAVLLNFCIQTFSYRRLQLFVLALLQLCFYAQFFKRQVHIPIRYSILQARCTLGFHFTCIYNYICCLADIITKKNNYVIPIIILISFILQFVSIFLKTIIMKSVLQDIRIYYIFINLLFLPL